jgi:hypothetical protein
MKLGIDLGGTMIEGAVRDADECYSPGGVQDGDSVGSLGRRRAR